MTSKQPTKNELNYEQEPKILSLYGMTTYGDLLRLKKVEQPSHSFTTCDISLNLGELATGEFVPVSTYGIYGVKLSEGQARLNPENSNQIHLFLKEVADWQKSYFCYY